MTEFEITREDIKNYRAIKGYENRVDGLLATSINQSRTLEGEELHISFHVPRGVDREQLNGLLRSMMRGSVSLEVE